MSYLFGKAVCNNDLPFYTFQGRLMNKQVDFFDQDLEKMKMNIQRSIECDGFFRVVMTIGYKDIWIRNGKPTINTEWRLRLTDSPEKHTISFGDGFSRTKEFLLNDAVFHVFQTRESQSKSPDRYNVTLWEQKELVGSCF